MKGSGAMPQAEGEEHRPVGSGPLPQTTSVVSKSWSVRPHRGRLCSGIHGSCLDEVWSGGCVLPE